MKRTMIIIMILITFFTVSCSNAIPKSNQESKKQLLNIEESNDRGLINAYMEAIKMLIGEDQALNHGTSFYAVEIDTFKGISKEDVIKIQGLIESMGKDFRDASMEELKNNGEFDEETMALKRSILIRVDEIRRYTDSSFVFTASKFRAGLGAIGMSFEFIKNENGWEFLKTAGFWIS